ncbi:MAG TPA: ABC transporter ATP-binding protein [Burkholderiaceae bacterium]|nr:ABC transporter ATP-binding protein [Burkholderiaceae bacterium]
MLAIRDLRASYGHNQALKGIDLDVPAGEITVLVGANGAGKTTLLRSISGVHKACEGTVLLDGRDIASIDAASRVALGIALVPEGRQVFASLSVEDNLRMGSYRRSGGSTVDRMLELFPELAAHRRRPAGLLSGGQQQMLAIGRALMSGPRVLLFDEPSMGLSPLLTRRVFQLIESLKAASTAILLVEQNADAALRLAQGAAVLELGRIVLRGPGAELLRDRKIQEAYLGI